MVTFELLSQGDSVSLGFGDSELLRNGDHSELFCHGDCEPAV